MPTIRSETLNDGQTIQYLVRRSRRSRRVRLRLYPDGVLRIAAPLRTSERSVQKEIQRCAAWIQSALNNLPAEKPVAEVDYSDGSQHAYLGQSITLKWAGSQVAPKFADGVLTVVASNHAEAGLALRSWYRQQARNVFAERLAYFSELAEWINYAPPMTAKVMTSRWGSCSVKGRVSLNLHLIKAPRFAIDEVVAHELCHLQEMNHGPRFYRLLDQLLPDWRESRRWLKVNGASLVVDHSLWK